MLIGDKYSGDYRLENELGADGKLRTETVYRGDWFRLDEDPAGHKRSAADAVVSMVLLWILVGIPLFLNSAMGHASFVIMPFALCLFAVLYYSLGAVSYAGMTEEPLTRRQAEKMEMRLAAGPLASMILSGVALIGEAVLIVRSRSELKMPADVICGICIVLVFAVSVHTFRRRKRGKHHKI